jgi:nitrogen regulatory protein PII
MMMKIEAIIKPSKLGEVQEALVDAGITGMTVFEVQGFGRQKGHQEMYRGAEYSVKFIPKVMIALVLPEAQVSTAMAVIRKTASTGKIGDGKIFVSPISECVRIRTGETGPEAL